MMEAADFNDVMKIASAGMRAQGERLRVIAENVANASSTATTAGGDPYRRRIVTFQNVLDRATGLETVKVGAVIPDRTDFVKEYNPTHPAADKDGYVKMPNVKPLLENIDMKEAQRTYEANLGVLDSARTMMQRALDVLRG